MIMSQANDLSFQVLAHTKIVTNQYNPSIQGTLFSGFVMQSNVLSVASPLIQVELDDFNPSALDISKYYYIYFSYKFDRILFFLILNLELYVA